MKECGCLSVGGMFMNITVVGTGYVGLVTGVSLAEVGHTVTCLDIDEEKIKLLEQGVSPIYELGLSEMLQRNLKEKKITFTTDKLKAYQNATIIYIAVGTPENEDGSANLMYIENAAKDIAEYVTNDVIVVTKSTVPVGTNGKIQEIILSNICSTAKVSIASNPEFLREGSAVNDAFCGDRVVIGTECEETFAVLESVNKPFGIPIYRTDIKSAEMIKYASNAFLATKISFINEISNICELLGANIEDVAEGMGMDKRIGNQFLKAGIGYGGSCFPKDTKALIQIAGNVNYDFKLLKGVVNVNKKQQRLLMDKLNAIYPSLKNRKIAVLGLTFKPGTDDMREAPSILVTEALVEQEAEVVAFDPVALEKAKSFLHGKVQYAETIEKAVADSDAVLILTEWEAIKNMDLGIFTTMKFPIVLDGRNCFSLDAVKKYEINYHSIGRPSLTKLSERAPV